MSEGRKPLILSALRMEVRAIKRAIGNAADVEVMGLRARRLRSDWASGNPTYLIVAGLGGGLDPALAVGDLVLDDPGGLVRSTSIRRGLIHTAEKVIASPAEKQALWKQTGAIVGDMESAILRAAAKQAGIPYIGLRSISDRADQTIDERVLGLVDEVGSPRAVAVAKFLAMNPGMIGELRQLQRQADLALNSLAAGVRDIIAELGRQ